MIPDQLLASYVESFVREGGAGAFSSLDAVIRQLEIKLGMDLSSKASFINDQIYILLGPHFTQLPIHSSVTVDAAHFSQPYDNTSFCFSSPMVGTVEDRREHLDQHQFQLAAPEPTPARCSANLRKESATIAPKRRGGPGGLSKICGVSPELQTIVGEPTMARTEIVKQLWAYIRRNNLQDPNNKRKIICNDELRLVFETDSTDMFKMNKLLSKHIKSLEHTKEPGPDSKRLKKCDKEMDIAPETQVVQYPVVISDGLAEFLGIREKEIIQSEALRLVWEYIEANHLEDHRNNMILCDKKLQQLFACESLSASGVSKMLEHHLFKQS